MRRGVDDGVVDGVGIVYGQVQAAQPSGCSAPPERRGLRCPAVVFDGSARARSPARACRGDGVKRGRRRNELSVLSAEGRGAPRRPVLFGPPRHLSDTPLSPPDHQFRRRPPTRTYMLHNADASPRLNSRRARPRHVKRLPSALGDRDPPAAPPRLQKTAVNKGPVRAAQPQLLSGPPHAAEAALH